ncbi:helix-turn-helix domain-containing protein [Lysobacter antibioticus]|uniref:helix-turn-helix domain-containing protein n=1 Tax=Lysobacter antibioticus TaxID=84531 RepID=UPI0011401542|nr:helix-turn-helix transcriptional regulator [Lysobacter antibioticus]
MPIYLYAMATNPPFTPVGKKPRPTPAKGSGRRVQLPLLAIVGERVKTIRQERGLSQDDLAVGIPMDRSHLSMIEAGKAAVTVMTLYKLAFALDCEVGQFLPARDEARKALKKRVETE